MAIKRLSVAECDSPICVTKVELQEVDNANRMDRYPDTWIGIGLISAEDESNPIQHNAKRGVFCSRKCVADWLKVNWPDDSALLPPA